MQPAPRHVCLAGGGDILGRSGGAAEISGVLSNYFAPAAADATHQKVRRYVRFRRADLPVDEYIAEYDPL